MQAPPGNLTLGLSEAEAEARLAAEGFNELPGTQRRTVLRIAAEVMREPMFLLLIGGGLVYLAVGDREEALILLAFACMSVIITVVQETRTERVLEALRDMTSPRALVIRDGQRRRIAGREVVRGDLIVLAEGDRVPADAVLLEAIELQADESLLTGESVPVRKLAKDKTTGEFQRPGGDDQPVVYSGSLVVRGNGIGEVVATGSRSEIGKIGASLGTLEAEPPRLQLQIRRLVQLAAAGGLIISAASIVLYGLLRGGWLDAILAGIAIGMAMLPEEFPVVLTVFMAMGAWRISRARVLTRRAAAIETLGSATVLCTDKTGTLTQNKMSIVELQLANGRATQVTQAAELPIEFRDLLRFGVLASAPEPFDPMEMAFHDLERQQTGSHQMIGQSGWTLARSYGIRPTLLAMTQVWSAGGTTESVVAAKGASEAIAELSGLQGVERERVRAAADLMAKRGLRVLGVACGTFAGGELPESPRGFAFRFLGLVALADPLRASVPAAVAECRSAGIRPIMITGDYPATAAAIAAEAGFADGELLTGKEIEQLTDDDLARRARTAAVFARIMPEQKLRIVQALKRDGEIVAMTGDGVNDAPSLKAAHIGVAMGGRGTDVAREASSIVLLDDDFGSIVSAIRLGRRIFDNLRKALGFIVAVHIPIASLALLPLVFGLPIIFGPIHIAFLEMMIDPVCSLVFEAEKEEDDLMTRPPRDPNEPLFSWALIAWSVMQGALAAALVAGIFLVALHGGMPDDEVRALTFFSLVTAIVALVLVNRSFSSSVALALLRPNPALRWILLAVAAMLTLALAVPSIADLFRFGPLHSNDLALTLGAGLVVLLALELIKPLWRRRLSNAIAS
jgi:Ca2+-transporting ATPase